MKKTLSILTILITFITVAVTAPVARAISKEDYEAVYKNTVFYDPNVAACSSVSLTGGNNVEASYNYFVGKGLTPEQSAGIVGNLQAESGPDVDPKIHQGGGGPGRGIAQWEYKNGNSDRWSNLLAFATAQGRDPYSLDLQLDYLWFEFTGEPPTAGARGGSESGAFGALKAATSVYDAAKAFMTKFERPKNQSASAIQGRANLAQDVFAKFSGNAVPASAGTGTTCTGTNNGVAIGVEGLYFPLIITKSKLGSWRPSQNSHPYKAHDIFADPGTPIVAVEGGKVTMAKNELGGYGSSVAVVGEKSGHLYYYTHMSYSSIIVAKNQQVTAGSQLGTVGPSSQAGGTQPHLHMDLTAAGTHSGQRQACSRKDPAACARIQFFDFIPQLTVLYEALP